MLQVVTAAASQAMATGGSITIGNAAQVCVAAGLTFLIHEAGPFDCGGTGERRGALVFWRGVLAIAWGLGRARGTGRQIGQFTRGAVLDRETTGGIVSRARQGFRFSAACARSSGAITRSGQECGG